MRLRFLILMMTTAGCAGRGELAPGPAELSARESSQSRDVITRAELENLSAGTALEVIQAMRPQWLRLRDEMSLTGPNDLVVYLNNANMGGRAALRSISLVNVESIKYFDSAAAYVRWGYGHGHGVILISKTFYEDPRAF